MARKSYYQTMFRRRNVIKEALLNFALGLSSWPRMLIEILIRRNFGQRYFSASGAVTLAVMLAIMPIFLIGSIRYRTGGSEYDILFGKFLTWYLYVVAFMYSASQRHEEVKRLIDEYNFDRFTLFTGIIHDRFWKFEFNGKRYDKRQIEIILEPGLFFFIGLGLCLAGQAIGYVLVISSLFYSFSYAAAYHDGENFILDKNDERICSRELVNTFTEDLDPQNSKGFNFYVRRPADPEARRQMAEMFMADADIVEAV